MSIGERCYWGLSHLETVSTQFDKEPYSGPDIM